MLVRNMLAAATLLLAAAPMSAGIGDKLSNARFTTTGGQSMTMADLRGEVVVLNYWVSDCELCQKQLNILDYYYRQRRDYGLKVMAIAPEDLSERELNQVFKDRIIHPLSSVSGDFGPRGSFPTTYIIDRHGQLRYAASGALDIEKLNEILVPLLREPQP
jgi:peroxiredoxin